MIRKNKKGRKVKVTRRKRKSFSTLFAHSALFIQLKI